LNRRSDAAEAGADHQRIEGGRMLRSHVTTVPDCGVRMK